MKLYKLFFLFLISTVVNAQFKKTLFVELNKVYEPLIEASIYSGENISLTADFVPKYTYKELINNTDSVKLNSFKVLEKEVLLTNLPKSVDVKDLPRNEGVVLRVIKARDQSFIKLKFNPLYISSSGEIIKIKKIEVLYDFYKKIPANKVSRVKLNKKVDSPLNSGVWYKIGVDNTGVFKMDFNFLKSIGIDVENLNPNKIRVFGAGGAQLPELLSNERPDGLTENAIYVEGASDGVFNQGDYVLFYGQGPVSWKYEDRLFIKHTKNIYSDLGYYFVNVDSGVDGKRITQRAAVSQTKTKIITTFSDLKLHEQDLTNYARAGKQWFGEDFSVNNKQTFEFNFENIVKTVPVSIEGRFSARSSNGVTSFDIRYNNASIVVSNVSRSSTRDFFRTSSVKDTLTPVNDLLEIELEYDNKGDISAESRLDYLRLVADRRLIANDTSFRFFNFDSKLDTEILEYEIRNSENIDFVWNVSDPFNIVNIKNQEALNSLFRFKEITNGEVTTYFAVNKSNTLEPINLGDKTLVENQNLHALENVHYLIITAKSFISEANRIKKYHEEHTKISDLINKNINVTIVDVEEIYNEFGSGSPDVTAIRDFVKHVYDKGVTEDTKLKYLCLFGDASFDYKGLEFKMKSIVPTYSSFNSRSLSTSYNSDDYYAFLDTDDDTSDNDELDRGAMLDIITGRVPVKNTQEAKVFVNKLLNYYSKESFGSWKNNITLLGDDGKDKKDEGLIKALESASDTIEAYNNNYNISKLYTDAFKEEITAGGGRYPEIKRKFINAFNTGSLIINYFGHGNVFALGQENFLDISDIRSIRNTNNLPLFITVTCDFSRFDDPTIVSGGEEMITGQFGSAGSMITTSREIFINSGKDLNESLAKFLTEFDGKKRTVAEVLRDAKNSLDIQGEFFTYFFGDPAMRLSIPESGIKINNIKKYTKSVTTQKDTLIKVNQLKGLSKVNVSGSIVNTEGERSDFTGDLSVVLFDKEIERKTLLNEAGGVTPGNIENVVEFTSLENKVFVGNASVKKGKFSFDFVLPKDVSTEPGTAKFSFYAASGTEERIGSDFSFEIGGLESEIVEDTTPPVINLFMEDKTFVDGANTTSTPKLIAEIQDENGVNTSLNSIGHNISLVIDGDFSNPITLNDFYSTVKDDFTKGIVDYELEELSEGNHTITFKAWDTHNNSTTQTLNFFVEQDTGFKIEKVLNYPNPFINHTEFWFKNNRQGDPLEIKVQIYTVSGKLVKSIISSDSNTSDIIRSVTWDGKDDFGNRLGKGVYIYKISVKEIISGQTDEKTEKLVIL